MWRLYTFSLRMILWKLYTFSIRMICIRIGIEIFDEEGNWISKYLPRLCCFSFYVKYFVLFHDRNSYFFSFYTNYFWKLRLKFILGVIYAMHSLLKICFLYFLRTRWDFVMCLSVFCWNSVVLPMWNTVIRNFDFNWINIWSLFTDFQNASLLLIALISHKIS